MTAAPRPSRLAWAGLLVVSAVAWSVPPGRIAEDTKNDLYVDPWGFLGRALHLWDPQVSWGGLQNQAFGYLFPMGPFFALGSELFPVWVVQRLWWMSLLSAGFVVTLGLLRALGVGTGAGRVLAALAYVLAPRVVSTIGGLSSEAQPQLLAPAILWPLVLTEQGRLGPRRGAALSGVAILCCGGVNATATAFAILPSALWLLTRRAWWRRPLTWLWGAAVVAATSWWVVPLAVMGRYSPPFLDWIENARTVSGQITLLDVLRGTTHWLGHLVTPGGAWWPAGHELVTSRTSIVLTATVMSAGLAGVVLAPPRHRTFLWVVLTSGFLAMSLPHSGPLASPLVEASQSALDGPLVALRNIHKADLLVRMPLAVGLAVVLAQLGRWRPRRPLLRTGAVAVAVGCVVGAASPGFLGAIATRGTFEEMAPQWRELGRWLDARPDERALIVPAANFGEYGWGRTIDEPLRALSSAPYAVRDAVPLTPAGTVRLLDEVEGRLQTGQSLGGATAMLRSAGVRHLVLRNDLDPGQSGQPPVALARAAVLATPDVTFTKGFGQTTVDAAGERVHPVEVYSLAGEVAPELAAWDATDVVGVTGATEDLARLEDAGVGGRPVIFDGDRTSALTPGREVVTDGFRARTRWFGAERGQDVTSGLRRELAQDAPDYLPWPEVARRSLTEVTGVRAVSASSSLAEVHGFAGLHPAYRPFAALDGDATTGWATMWDPSPRLTIDLEQPIELDRISVSSLVDRGRFGDGLAVATDVIVSTGTGQTRARLDDTGAPTSVVLPRGETDRVSITIMRTTAGSPARVITGLAEVDLEGLTAAEVVTTPDTQVDSADTAVLGAGLPGRDGCAALDDQVVCFTGELVDPESTGPMVRDVVGLSAGESRLRGTLAVDPRQPPTELLTVPGVRVVASSVRGQAPAGRAVGVVDGDPRTAWSPSPNDENPSLTLTLDDPVTISTLRLQTRREWAEKESPAVLIDVDGVEVTRRLSADGVLSIPPTRGHRLTLSFIHIPGERRPGTAALELEEVQVGGRPFASPPQQLMGECGTGPAVTVDGRHVPTSAVGPRSALFGRGQFTWEACEVVTLSEAARHRIRIDPWRGLAPRSAVLSRDAERVGTGPEGLSVDRTSAVSLRAQVAAGPERLVVMAENANAGWEARVDDTPLVPQVVDGRRQGFVLPAGEAGALTIEFAPDTTYRWGLLLGLLLVGGLLLTAVWPDRAGRPEASRSTPPSERRSRSWSLDVTVVTLGWLTAGPVGAIVGVVAAVLCRVVRPPNVVWPATVAVLGLSAAVLQAWLSPGNVGRPLVEGIVRVVVLGAFLLALAASRQQPADET